MAELKPTVERPIVARSKIRTGRDGKPVVIAFTLRGWKKLPPIQHGGNKYPKNGFEIVSKYKGLEEQLEAPAKEPQASETDASIQRTKELLIEGSDKPTVPEIDALIEAENLMVPKGDLNKPEKIQAVLDALGVG